MAIARGLERRLERLFEGAAGRVFSGRLHPSELASHMARAADMARYNHPAGPATANHYVITVNDRDLQSDQHAIALDLGGVVDEYAAENGLRLEGPGEVVIRQSPEMTAGRFTCTAVVRPAPLSRWARVADQESYDIVFNRTIIGRGDGPDVDLGHGEISRKHALIWRSGGRAWISDMGSSNGTVLDGEPVGRGAVPLEHGSMAVFAGHRYRFLEG